MKKSQFNRNLDKLIDEMAGKRILRHTCQLLKMADKQLVPYASGVFVKIGEIHFLLTASHVTEGWSDENKLFIKTGETRHVSLVGGVRATHIEKSNGVDLAYIILDERIIVSLDGPYIFLPISKIRDHKKLLDATNYCIMGYPEKSLEEINGKMEPIAQAYYVQPCKEKVYEYYGFNSDDFCLMEIKGKGINVKNGDKRKVNTHFYGLSGCGLWLIIVNINGEEFVGDYRLYLTE